MISFIILEALFDTTKSIYGAFYFFTFSVITLLATRIKETANTLVILFILAK
jgi:hypothetical protein